MSNKKIRFGTILESHDNVDNNSDVNTAYINPDGNIAVKKDKGYDWDIKSNIKNKFISEFQEAQGTTNLTQAKKIYGFCWDQDEADPSSAITYTDDATGMSPIGFADIGSATTYGSFYDFITNFMGCRPVALYEDGTVYKYLNPNDYSKDIDGNPVGITQADSFDSKGRPYNIMIEFKCNWYKIWTVGSKLYFQIANYKVSDDFICDAFLYNNKPMQYLYVSAMRCEIYNINSEYKVRSVEDTNGVFLYNTSNVKSFLEKRKLLETYKNSSTFGFAQWQYLYLCNILLFKNINFNNVFDPKNRLSEYSTIMNGNCNYANGFSTNKFTDVYKKGLFYYNLRISSDPSESELSEFPTGYTGIGWNMYKFFGIVDLFYSYLMLDGLYFHRKTGNVYYETSPYSINGIDEIYDNPIFNIVSLIPGGRVEDDKAIYINSKLKVSNNKLLSPSPGNFFRLSTTSYNTLKAYMLSYKYYDAYYIDADGLNSVVLTGENLAIDRCNHMTYIHNTPPLQISYNVGRSKFIQFK